MLRTAAKLFKTQTAAAASRRFTTHIPQVSSMGTTSTLEHAPVEVFAGDIAFNEDIAIERFHEKAIATDSMRAAANFNEIRVVPSASSNYQNIHVV
ncbi:hypothetical protein GGI04_002733 [Coemansia thaxteri]|uniref:Uncharacterized protein n=1 Tax=Coemansia thaxteri TaxID=2663907 RepID=A0A9W8BJG6_9FUNG|nr:hypothetical protein H4R26_002733 [Coemansia thaxteri]KAJ2004072.1 hypothetical protein GGI04_002733 [Coemansia thaxteri]KAJ2468395.1 hypothetical protein GGI02_003711 [Coemansia sp. RSA 2322]